VAPTQTNSAQQIFLTTVQTVDADRTLHGSAIGHSDESRGYGSRENSLNSDIRYTPTALEASFASEGEGTVRAAANKHSANAT
jgi:hypothetical protein